MNPRRGCASANRRRRGRREHRLLTHPRIGEQVVRSLSLGTASKDVKYLASGLLGERRCHPNDPVGSATIAELCVSELLVGPLSRRLLTFASHTRETSPFRHKFPDDRDLRSMARRARGRRTAAPSSSLMPRVCSARSTSSRRPSGSPPRRCATRPLRSTSSTMLARRPGSAFT